MLHRKRLCSAESHESQIEQPDWFNQEIVPKFLNGLDETSVIIIFPDQDEIFAWGNNEYRQLGVASEAPQLCLPEAVDCSAMDGGVTALAAGGAFTAFLSCESVNQVPQGSADIVFVCCFAGKGSVYLAGYNIDAMQEAAKTPRSAHGPLLRQIHNAEVDARVSSLKAGLNYLLALTSSPSTGLIWGKLSLRKAMHCRTEVSIPHMRDINNQHC